MGGVSLPFVPTEAVLAQPFDTQKGLTCKNANVFKMP